MDDVLVHVNSGNIGTLASKSSTSNTDGLLLKKGVQSSWSVIHDVLQHGRNPSLPPVYCKNTLRLLLKQQSLQDLKYQNAIKLE